MPLIFATLAIPRRVIRCLPDFIAASPLEPWRQFCRCVAMTTKDLIGLFSVRGADPLWFPEPPRSGQCTHGSPARHFRSVNPAPKNVRRSSPGHGGKSCSSTAK